MPGFLVFLGASEIVRNLGASEIVRNLGASGNRQKSSEILELQKSSEIASFQGGYAFAIIKTTPLNKGFEKPSYIYREREKEREW